MNKKILLRLIFGATLLLLAACTQDEPTDPNALPEGKYPLQIASVTMSVESSEQPWSAKVQTRVTESENGNSSVWQTGDVFYVKFKGTNDVGTYKITDASTGAVEAMKPVYWRSASEEQTIIAWYASQEGGTIDVSDQTSELAYVIRAEQKATCNGGSPVSLQFSHQLSKVRVYLRGTAYEKNATGVTLSYPTSYTMSEGSVTQASTTNGTIQMHKAENADYYEALVLPGTIKTSGNTFAVTLNGTTTTNVNLSASLPLMAGSKHDVTLRLHKQGTTEIDLSELSSPYEISADGDYYFYDSGSNSIKVTGGNPNIYLGDATVSVNSGNAIDITNGSPSIHIQDNSTVTSSNGAGIYVADNSTVTIQGRSREDKLTVRGGESGAGIGGYEIDNTTAANCGNIKITNVQVVAHGSYDDVGNVTPGIGGAGNASCGTITIDAATVYAYGVIPGLYKTSSAIGCGISMFGDKGSFSTITIRNGSEVYVQRGNTYSDYIGYSGSLSNSSTGDLIATVDETSTVTKLN